MEHLEFDPLNASHFLDPHERLAKLRSKCPISQPNPWLVFVARDSDVRNIARDYESFSSAGSLVFDDSNNDSVMLLQLDPPRHTKYRRMLLNHLSKSTISSIKSDVKIIAERLVDGFIVQGYADLMQLFAVPYSALVVAHLVGVSEEQRPAFCSWAEEIRRNVPLNYKHVPGWHEFSRYIYDRIARRREGDDDHLDIISHLIKAEASGERLTDADICMAVLQLIIGGGYPVAYHIGNLVYELLHHHTLWERVERDRTLIPIAVNESLRHDPPNSWIMRICKKATDVADVRVERGMRVMLSLASANRDEEVWPEPHVFSLDRKYGERHVGFGYHRHVCLGASLALLEAEIALEVLLDRLPNLHLSPGFRYEGVEMLMLHGPKHIDVQW